MKKLIYLILAVGIVSIYGCNEDSPNHAKLSYKFEPVKSQGSTNGRIMANTIEFSSGYITVREIVFDGESNNGSVSITHEQISKIDYATGVSTPDLGVVLIPAGTYTSVNLGLELQDENSIPSILLEGTYVNGSDESISLRFEFNSGEVFEADAEGPITLEADESAIARITFDVVDWFSPISSAMLDNATRDSNGVIVISETSNATIFDIVADRLDVATQAVFE